MHCSQFFFSNSLVLKSFTSNAHSHSYRQDGFLKDDQRINATIESHLVLDLNDKYRSIIQLE